MRRLAVVLVITSFSACGADIDRSIALVTAPRVLAVRAEPAESAPGGAVTYTALAATPTGAQDDAAIDWSFCTSPSHAGEDSSVSNACVLATVDPAATGNGVSLATPTDACRIFGPLGMPTPSGKPVIQPTPPDTTGGYSQPVRLVWNDDLTFALERLTCPPIGVSLDLAQAYRDARKPNQNPHLLAFTGDVGGAPTELGTVAPGATVLITVTWTADSIESYANIDMEQSALHTQTEELWLAWFVTGGKLDHDFAIPPAGATSVANQWQAPNQGGTYYLWTVLHDSRGGVAFAEMPIAVE